MTFTQHANRQDHSHSEKNKSTAIYENADYTKTFVNEIHTAEKKCQYEWKILEWKVKPQTGTRKAC